MRDSDSGGKEVAALKFSINDFASVAALPPSVKAKWEPFAREGLSATERRANALRDASYHFYRALEEGRRSPVKQRHVKVADMRSRAAAAAAAAAAAQAAVQTDSERSAVLAARMLTNMQAAEQRRLEAQNAQRARLAAKSELIMTRLAASQARDKVRRQQLLNHLLGRLAHAEDVRQQRQKQALQQQQHPAKKARGSSSCGQLKHLIAVRGAEDWMEDLSPKTAASAAALRATSSTKRLQRTWRRFAAQRKTTAQLARTFAALGVAGLDDGSEDSNSSAPQTAQPANAASAEPHGPVPGVVMIGGLSSGHPSPRHARFEDFADKLQSPTTLRAAQALLRRLEQRAALRGFTNDGAQALLHQLHPSAPAGRKLDRYPVRVMLCAYMIKEHPEVVFSKVGDVEARLSAAADQLLAAFEALLARLLQPLNPTASGAAASSGAISPNGICSSPTAAAPAVTCPSPLTKSMASYMNMRGRPVARQLFSGSTQAGTPAAAEEAADVSLASAGSGTSSSSGSGSSSSGSVSGPQASLASLLVSFDDSWLEYLDQFVVWKGHDARGLEVELMTAALRLERSMRLKLGRREPNSPEVMGNPDLKAMVVHVAHDHALLAERIARLTGAEGSARLAAALDLVRQQVAAELTAAEEAAAAEGSEVSWEETEAGARPSSVPRSFSRGASLQDPLSDAEALAAAQQVQQAAAAEEAQKVEAAEQQAEALSNEQMVWEMLYNPAYSLPTTEAEAAWHRAMGKEVNEDEELDPSDVESMTPAQLTAMVASRARVIAERAFWDSIVWRFKTAVQGHALPSQLAPLLSELGTELSGFVTDPLEAQQLSEQYSEPAVLARLSSRTGQQGGGANLTALGAMMEQLARVLLTSGGPDRAAEGADATQQLHALMAAALAAAAAANSSAVPAAADASGTTSSPPVSHGGAAPDAPAAAALADALAAALRLLMTQLKLVKLDAANVRLAGLARAMRERGAVSYLQTKLAAAWQLPTAEGDGDSSSSATAAATEAAVAEKLQHTAAWVGQVQAEMVPQLQGGLSAAGLLLNQQAAAAAVVTGGLQSVELRSGVGALPTASPGKPAASPRSPGSAAAAGPVKPAFPVALDSWQGVVRAGLLALVTGDTPAAGPALPEVLMFDRARLHDLQNSLQQLMVTAAGLLIVQQLRQAAGLEWDAGMRAQARRRLLVVLSDPGMKLSHLVTELSQLAGAGSVATEQRVKTMFTTIVNPDTAAFKSIRSGIACSLAAHLMYGRAAMSADGAVASSCMGLLGRVGAAALAEDVAELGERLAAVAAVNEAVHGQLLRWLVAAGAAGR